MWPTTLDMTRDECKGIMRRMELETYSKVISTFRAQGSLCDSKAKMLDSLRAILHISQERHRAEARRVANDEELTTVAEILSGFSSNSEWCREGRRPYPLLPRSAPRSALCGLADAVAEVASQMNSNLPYSSETKRNKNLIGNSTSVVLNDPLNEPLKVVVPDQLRDLVHTPKRDLKRSLADAGPSPVLLFPAKKRSNHSPTAPVSPSALMPAPDPVLPLTTGKIQQIYHNQVKAQTTPRQRKPNAKKPGPKPKGDGQKSPRQSKAKLRKETSLTPVSSAINTNVIHSYATSPLTPTPATNRINTTVMFDQNELISGELLVTSPNRESTAFSASIINSEEKDSQSPESNVKVVYATSINTLAPLGSSNQSTIVLNQSINHQPITEQTPITWIPKTPQVPHNSASVDMPPVVSATSPARPYKLLPIAATTPTTSKKAAIIMSNSGNVRNVTPIKMDIEKGVTITQKKMPIYISASPVEANVPADHTNPIHPTIATVLSPTGAVMELPTQARMPTNTVSDVPPKSNKIQIKSQIIFNPGGINPTVKLSSSSLKSLQNKGNFKLISAGDGKVLLQNDNTKKMFAQRLATTNPVTPTVAGNKKVSLQLMAGKESVKQNLFPMPGSVVTLGNGQLSKTIRGFTKDGKFIIQPTALRKSPNVIVLDMNQKQKNQEKPTVAIKDNNILDNRITEDTPVDILPATTPNIVNYVLKSNNTGVEAGSGSNAEPVSTAVSVNEISSTDWEMELDQTIQQQQRAEVTALRKPTILLQRKSTKIGPKQNHVAINDDFIEYVEEERLDEDIQMQDDAGVEEIFDDENVVQDNSEIIIEEDPQFEKENDYVDTEHLDNEEIQQDVVLCDFYDEKAEFNQGSSQCDVSQ